MKRTEHTQKWLDALRSGEYKQCGFSMHNAGMYCCLGVAAELIGCIDDANKYEIVNELYGLEWGESIDLMGMNDKDQKTFPQIADEIEKMLDVN